MKITRHIHFLENPTTCIRHEFTFDSPYELKSTLGKVDPIYPGVDFSKDGNRARLARIQPIVNTNGLLHIRELMNAGEILSIELRVKHRLNKIILDDAHQLEILAGDSGLLYWINIGKAGALVVTGRLIPDDDGFYHKLKTDLTDTAMRAYLVQRTLADAKETAEVIEKLPDIMTHDEAARYLRLEPGTLYNIREIPRLKHNRYRKSDLDRYLEVKPGKKRR